MGLFRVGGGTQGCGAQIACITVQEDPTVNLSSSPGPMCTSSCVTHKTCVFFWNLEHTSSNYIKKTIHFFHNIYSSLCYP
uniref:Uncharacterized protein n=1 Tax=Anguilla anguilla TaxID=7936 RepID=A0A0E9R926_ANGAN